MSRFQAMVLAINTSILAVIFAFSSWLYLSTRSEVEAQVASSLERAAKMTDALARLKERELSALAQSMAVSPMLRGAAATGDAATIRDVLETLRAKNGAGAIELVGRARHASRGEAAGFKGSAPAGEGELRVWLAPDRELLESWTGVTGVRYALSGGDAAHNLPQGDEALASRPLAGSVRPVDGEKGRYYALAAPLAGGAVKAAVFAERAPFWRAFESRRNSLVVLGAALFFGGLLLSALFAGLIDRAGGPAAPAQAAEFQRLLDEIEAARASRPRPGK